MELSLVNDWRFLFSKHAIGGRLASFSFITISYIRINEPLVDGFTVVIFGVGVTIKKASELTK